MNKLKIDKAELAGAGGDAEPLHPTQEALAQLMALAREDELLDEFLEGAAAARDEDPDLIGDLVLKTLSRFRASEEDDQFRNHCNFEVHSDKFAVFVLEDREKVVASNRLARERFGITAATPADQLDLVGMDGRPLTEIVTQAMEQRDPTSDIVPIAQAYSPSKKRRLDVAILHLHVCALMGITKEVILICDAITPATLELFAEKFGLTPAEAAIVERFSAGQSIEEIAASRVRSLATVKTQFYKILEKCGAGSQSELLQMVARIESLNAATAGINTEFSHPHRRTFTIMRPGNRTLDVVSAGKPDGRPVVSCNTFMFRTFPAWLEEELYQNNLKLYSIAPPGSGETSPPLDGQSMEECFAGDLRSLVDNIGCDSTVLIGSGVAFPLCLEAAHLLPERIKAVFSPSLYAPLSRVKAATAKSDPVSTLRDLTLARRDDAAEIVSGALFRFINRFGMQRCVELVLKQNRDGRKLMMRTDHMNALKKAFAASIAQGVDFNAEAFRSSVSVDWEPRLASCPVPVHLAIGDKDALGPFEAVEALAADHPGKVTLSRVEGASALYPFTHHQDFFDAVSRAFETP